MRPQALYRTRRGQHTQTHQRNHAPAFRINSISNRLKLVVLRDRPPKPSERNMAGEQERNRATGRAGDEDDARRYYSK